MKVCFTTANIMHLTSHSKHKVCHYYTNYSAGKPESKLSSKGRGQRKNKGHSASKGTTQAAQDQKITQTIFM